MTGREIGVGVVGLGVMGKAHVSAYRAAREAGFPCRLVAVADRNPKKLAGDLDAVSNIKTDDASGLAFDPREVKGYCDALSLFHDPNVDAVSICTRTETHVALAIAALAAGKHVLLEKPIALRAAEIRPLVLAAASTDRVLMPAMCMRFWPGWVHLAIWVPLTIILALVLLQPFKGAVIGLQWANRMHGFGAAPHD